ncbi:MULTISPECIES: nucleotidyltransferase family protein [Exiguobacterium]|uniref:Nucleotidyltransferase family protein n=1 Tax=Exiguobacterium antarcticum TaxID=132920 RepID=A0ABT6R5U7_9BACL|nr:MULTISPECIES: nucleotidyltransferase family protein [Exiguobacterium]MCT4779642.1 nucleotidyltransferase family protein [Exiguobacterium soli]MDI3236311.1 nucleotidyltransferase family protein [Exiguobacterium antarcticum]
MHRTIEIEQLLQENETLMEHLALLDRLGLPDAWICAGYIRSLIWGLALTDKQDIDVVYYDATDTSEATEKQYEEKLKSWQPLPWSVKNQARMHHKNNLPPYRSTCDAIAHFPETVTAIAAKLTDGQFQLYLAYGAEDLHTRTIRPTPLFSKGKPKHAIFQKRVIDKDWDKRRDLRIAYQFETNS